jgi:ribosomal protein L11 methylase PrmA
LKNTIQYNHTQVIHNNTAALEILPFVFDHVKVESIIDIGCGNGIWLQAARSLGLNDIYGVDGIIVGANELLISETNFLKKNKMFLSKFYIEKL